MSVPESTSTLVEGILLAVKSFTPPRPAMKFSFDFRALDNKALGIFNVPSVKQECISGWFVGSLMPSAKMIVSIYIDENHEGYQGHMYIARNARQIVDTHILMSRENLEQLPEDLPEDLLEKILKTVEL